MLSDFEANQAAAAAVSDATLQSVVSVGSGRKTRAPGAETRAEIVRDALELSLAHQRHFCLRSPLHFAVLCSTRTMFTTKSSLKKKLLSDSEDSSDAFAGSRIVGELKSRPAPAATTSSGKPPITFDRETGARLALRSIIARELNLRTFAGFANVFVRAELPYSFGFLRVAPPSNSTPEEVKFKALSAAPVYNGLSFECLICTLLT